MSRSAKLKPLPWRKLSEDAAYPKTPEACQCCGQAWDVRVWIECDEADRPTSTAITVCDDCVKVHITPHERLYEPLERNRPFPGAMITCIGCLNRDGMACTSKLLKSNGGAGLPIRANKPTATFMCGSKPYHSMDYGLTPPKCEGREVLRLLPAEAL